ncbi:MAG: hypothetical protein A2365_03475 [Candidatus Nealsonbacteria bacterium RIFOXYB1_FULL_40_15]|uniref:4Fe-4S ferredoxin-type domain-containing protein n=2 Tax=Candidatus Nealsoniibacteriota TaxID=1817911 RepID=A0A1G2ERE5_9BACT|nr:MAG: hypothetical protein A2365_03475 [Candidatus Nealsonbacteria bacterium RIFOXYB1_FULL_40_15]OGZ28365.1 MAG: hypothetical protein A2427_01155 [Candidatus Nealsonbacteria bacterium RIFOXYC1_FULL_40_7]OGZ29490.1 MAG: hypothetical protein A2562_02250 [Candidatus Nealsonbacteria bacterium RIFOXYD1_FULL_39_11]
MKIKQEHKKCIGCGVCVSVCPKRWEFAEDGKARPIGGELMGDFYELVVEKEEECNKQAQDSCPVRCIMLE